MLNSIIPCNVSLSSATNLPVNFNARSQSFLSQLLLTVSVVSHGLSADYSVLILISHTDGRTHTDTHTQSKHTDIKRRRERGLHANGNVAVQNWMETITNCH